MDRFILITIKCKHSNSQKLHKTTHFLITPQPDARQSLNTTPLAHCCEVLPLCQIGTERSFISVMQEAAVRSKLGNFQNQSGDVQENALCLTNYSRMGYGLVVLSLDQIQEQNLHGYKRIIYLISFVQPILRLCILFRQDQLGSKNNLNLTNQFITNSLTQQSHLKLELNL